VETKHLSNYRMEQVESFYHQGIISQIQYEAFMHVWVKSAHRFVDYPGWDNPHEDVIPLIAEIKAAL
jgi:hypothetical protein